MIDYPSMGHKVNLCNFFLHKLFYTPEKIDIVKLNAEIEEIVMRENELREAIRNIIEEIEVGV